MGTAQWLAELGAGRLILVDEREPGAAQTSALQRLHAAGRPVITDQSAAADPAALPAVAEEAKPAKKADKAAVADAKKPVEGAEEKPVDAPVATGASTGTARSASRVATMTIGRMRVR